jgi:hypothetical protein
MSSSAKSIIDPRKPACRRWPGCGALCAGRRRPGWRPCSPLTHCASRMATSGPPCGGALGSPTSPMEIQPLLAFAALSSARRTLSTPSPAVPPISCACCAMMKLWTLCAARCGGAGFLRRRSPVSPCCIRSWQACGGHRQACGDLLFSLEGQRCEGDVSFIHPGATAGNKQGRPRPLRGHGAHTSPNMTTNAPLETSKYLQLHGKD